MNIYFDMDETLLSEDYYECVYVIPIGIKMVRYAKKKGYNVHVLTTSMKNRAIDLIGEHYPNTFQSLQAREDFCIEQDDGPWAISSQISVIRINVDPDALLVDNDTQDKLSCSLKSNYLGTVPEKFFHADLKVSEKIRLARFKRFINKDLDRRFKGANV